jgi:hypothetical protein
MKKMRRRRRRRRSRRHDRPALAFYSLDRSKFRRWKKCSVPFAIKPSLFRARQRFCAVHDISHVTFLVRCAPMVPFRLAGPCSRSSYCQELTGHVAANYWLVGTKLWSPTFTATAPITQPNFVDIAGRYQIQSRTFSGTTTYRPSPS